MKGIIFTCISIVTLSMTLSAQNLRFWAETNEDSRHLIITVYARHMQVVGEGTETLKGLNLRYYYENNDLQYKTFELSPPLLEAGFSNFGGGGNFEFGAGDLTRHETADRFVGQAPFVFNGGLEMKAGDRVLIGTLTFNKAPTARQDHINAYLIGADIFHAITYTALPDCAHGCPLIIISPLRPTNPGEEIKLDVEKYGPTDSHLTWGVNSPDGVQNYIVERMIGESTWEQLATLKADGQFINVYVDKNAYDDLLQKQTISYRIRVNKHIGEGLSEIKQVDFSSQKMFIELYPNPATDKVQVTMTATETNGTAYLEIYSTDGRLVYRNALHSGAIKEQIDLASANVNSGSYTIHLVSDGEILDVRPLHVMR